MITKTFSVFFWLKKPRQHDRGLLPIYLRITAGGQRTEYSVQRKWDLARWDSVRGRAVGKKEDVKTLNVYLDTVQRKVYEAYQALLDRREEITAKAIKDHLLGVKERPRMVLEIFAEHNSNMAALVGNGYAHQTHKRYETTLDHTRAFLQWKFKIVDLDISKINYSFLSDFEFYLRSVRRCGHNSTVKYLANFKKIVLICVKKDWLPKDPFVGYSLATKEVAKPYLDAEELRVLAEKEFSIERLRIVRDIFLFSCYTGLAYVDVHKLKRTEIVRGIDGDRWIFTHRQKTEVSSRIPLLPICLDIIERYKDHPQCVSQDRLLPVWSNQKMNSYLKEIADICEIRKTLTYHVARHTFATTVTLNNGVPLETVAKMLGHKTLRMTQHYAKILDRKVSEDMSVLKNKLMATDLNKKVKHL